MTIKELDIKDLQEALDLVWKVFLEFEAPEYADEGVHEFKQFIEYDNMLLNLSSNGYLMWTCSDGDNIVGILSTRPPCHISLLFVDKEYHRQGIARALFEKMTEYFRLATKYSEITVNSSPYAAEAYHKLGFVDTDTEQIVNGIRFFPMKRKNFS